MHVQFLHRRGRPSVQHHESEWYFLQARIRHADRRRLQHGGMPVQNAFDFRRIDVLTAGYDQISLALQHADVAVGVALRDVTGPVPPVA